MYEDLEVKLPLAGITIAAAYMLMVAIDAILHQQFEAIESETNAANAETENEGTKKCFTLRSGYSHFSTAHSRRIRKHLNRNGNGKIKNLSITDCSYHTQSTGFVQFGPHL